MAGKLDRETVRFHELVITVAEPMKPDISESANVTVEVTDVNDNTPKFQNDTYKFEVSFYHLFHVTKNYKSLWSELTKKTFRLHLQQSFD